MNRLDSYSAAIEDVIVLIRSGRVGMALTVLEGLNVLVDGALVEAMWEANRMGLRGEPVIRSSRKAKRRRKVPRRHEWLAERIRDPELRAKAKAVLRLDDRLLDAIASGGVGLGSSCWRKLRRELGG